MTCSTCGTAGGVRCPFCERPQCDVHAKGPCVGCATDWSSLVPADSRAFRQIGWHEGNLYVQFDSGTRVKYFGISRETFEKMMSSKSKGKYFAENIRDKYKAIKVERDENA